MSGFEIAGVVLGVLPLVIEAAKGYMHILSSLKDARRNLKALVHDLETEQIRLETTYEVLLDGVAPPSAIDRMIRTRWAPNGSCTTTSLSFVSGLPPRDLSFRLRRCRKPRQICRRSFVWNETVAYGPHVRLEWQLKALLLTLCPLIPDETDRPPCHSQRVEAKRGVFFEVEGLPRYSAED